MDISEVKLPEVPSVNIISEPLMGRKVLEVVLGKGRPWASPPVLFAPFVSRAPGTDGYPCVLCRFWLPMTKPAASSGIAVMT